MKKRTKLTICLGVICALLVAISSWYTIAFNNSRFIVPMDLSEYVFRVQDLPMIISGVLLTLYIVNIVVLFLESIKTNRRRELTLQSTRTINPKLGFLGLLGFAGFWDQSSKTLKRYEWQAHHKQTCVWLPHGRGRKFHY